MRGWTLVCVESGIEEVEEVALCVWITCFQVLAFVQAGDAAKVCEALLEPEIVPPLHGNEIAEPHVGELVKVQVCMRHPRKVRPLVCRHQRTVCNSDGTNVLHSAYPELGHVDHIVLIIGKFVAEELLIEIYSILDYPEYLCRIAVLKLAPTCENSHRSLSRLRVIFNHLVFTGTHAVYVRTNRRTFLEVPEEAP